VSGASGDEVLVRLAVGGDRAAFGALVTPHVTDLTRLCRRVAGPALADDCVQDTLLRRSPTCRPNAHCAG